MDKVLVDANILYARTLRDWFGMLAVRKGEPLFRLRWTEDIMTETLYCLRKENPFWDEPQIGGIRRRIEQQLGNSAQIKGYRIDPDLAYTDPHDAHVHAAAVHGGVKFVVSDDKGFRKFVEAHDEMLDYEHYTADEFLTLVDDNSAPTIREVLIEQIEYFKTRDGSFNLVTMLRNAGAPTFAGRIQRHLRSPIIARHLSASAETRTGSAKVTKSRVRKTDRQ